MNNLFISSLLMEIWIISSVDTFGQIFIGFKTGTKRPKKWTENSKLWAKLFFSFLQNVLGSSHYKFLAEIEYIFLTPYKVPKSELLSTQLNIFGSAWC